VQRSRIRPVKRIGKRQHDLSNGQNKEGTERQLMRKDLVLPVKIGQRDENKQVK